MTTWFVRLVTECGRYGYIEIEADGVAIVDDAARFWRAGEGLTMGDTVARVPLHNLVYMKIKPECDCCGCCEPPGG